jgi:hypothetical protein
MTLPGDTPSPRRSNLASRRYLFALLAAPEFDRHRVCTDIGARTHFITPRTLTLTVGTLAFRVVNDDPSGQQAHALSGCDGVLIFEGVTKP